MGHRRITRWDGRLGLGCLPSIPEVEKSYPRITEPIRLRCALGTSYGSGPELSRQTTTFSGASRRRGMLTRPQLAPFGHSPRYSRTQGSPGPDVRRQLVPLDSSRPYVMAKRPTQLPLCTSKFDPRRRTNATPIGT